MNNYYDRNTLRRMGKHSSAPKPYYEKVLKRLIKIPMGSNYIANSYYGYTEDGDSIILFIYDGHYEKINSIFHTFKIITGKRNHNSEENLWTSMYSSFDGTTTNDSFEIMDEALFDAVDHNHFVRVSVKEAAKIILLGEVTDEFASFEY